MYYYYQTLGHVTDVQESTVATPTPTTEATATTTATVKPSATITADPNAVPIIQIYDGGAGATVVDQIVATLSANKFEAEKLGTAQLEYAKTYIYYRAPFEAQAQAIGKLMPTRDVVLRTTVIDGAFDILIYAGKK
jgi:cyclopropane fatty-acyl-phospholipid synthase-like methyltransferase